MFGKSHKVTTRRALKILADIMGHVYVTTGSDKELIISKCGSTDHLTDLEFVDVESGRDDPHVDDGFFTDDDQAHKIAENGDSLTAFNHFIDIPKGRGQFDDFDGYSYFLGSGHMYQYQDASEVTDGIGWVAASATGYKVDEGIADWYEDEYVHIPGDDGYNRCSLAVERYSFYQDRGRYGSKGEELAARFPKASCWGGEDEGIPFSVFMPVDNLARFWYQRFLDTLHPKHLGHVMHAIQDASIPHHAAGCFGNWHKQYEDDLDADERIKAWVEQDADFEAGVVALANSWTPPDPNPPNRLRMEDVGRRPARNWRIDRLVTWMALNAYREYENTYDSFSNGYTPNEQSMRELTQKAVAMSVLVLRKATLATLRQLCYLGDKPTKILHKNDCSQVAQIPAGNIERFVMVADAKNAGYRACLYCLPELLEGKWRRDYYIGNLRSGELHLPECRWVEQMSEKYKEIELDLRDALDRNFNGCHYCMREIDTG